MSNKQSTPFCIDNACFSSEKFVNDTLFSKAFWNSTVRPSRSNQCAFVTCRIDLQQIYILWAALRRMDSSSFCSRTCRARLSASLRIVWQCVLLPMIVWFFVVKCCICSGQQNESPNTKMCELNKHSNVNRIAIVSLG